MSWGDWNASGVGAGTGTLDFLGVQQNTIDIEVINTGFRIKSNGATWDVLDVFGAEILDIGGTLEMIYKKLGNTDIEISIISMGGHEYLSDGRSRGFNEDFERATKTHHIFPGFGGDIRKKVLTLAFEHGLNFFDVTQDSEKEALGRNLKEIPPPYDIYIQTRPEGMAYMYDPYNAKMAQYDLLKAEVQRIVKLLQRERIDFFEYSLPATRAWSRSGVPW